MFSVIESGRIWESDSFKNTIEYEIKHLLISIYLNYFL
jgi:hypothetical protein